jgi:hypothetical protein
MNEQAIKDGFNHMSFKQISQDSEYPFVRTASISMVIDDVAALDWREYCLGIGISCAQHISQGLKEDDAVDIHSLGVELVAAEDNILTVGVQVYSTKEPEAAQVADNTPE